MGDERADIDCLKGRTYVTASGNVVRVAKIADGALRAWYRDKPTADDMNEFEAFVDSVLRSEHPGEPVITRSVGLEAEAANYAIWKKRFVKREGVYGRDDDTDGA
jgi:hypothetical protein